MKLKEATETFGIPANVIARMAQEGLIGLPLDETDVSRLSLLSQLWGRSWFVTASLKGIRARDRTMILLFPEYNKIDRYIIKSFINAADMRHLSPEIVKYRVKMAFAADVETQRIRKMKSVALNVKGRKKKLLLGKLSIDYADILGIQ